MHLNVTYVHRQAIGALLTEFQSFSTIIAFTIVMGIPVRKIRNPVAKQALMAVFGMTFFVISSGVESLHFFTSIFFGIFLIKHIGGGDQPRRVFVYSFAYRIFFCLSGHLEIGLPKVDLSMTNSAQLLITVKLVSLAYEINTYRKLKKRKSSKPEDDDNTDIHEPMPLLGEPSFYEMTCYMFCYINTVTGPFYSFRVYWDMVHTPFENIREMPKKYVAKIFVEALAFFVLYFVGREFFSSKYMIRDEFYDNSLFYRVFYSIPTCVVLLLKFSAVWYLVEVGNILSGLGEYSKSMCPKPGQGVAMALQDRHRIDNIAESEAINEEYSYETIHNIDPYQTLFGITARQFFRSWNLTIQWWLVRYVYSSTILPQKWKFTRVMAVMFISAIWHGLHGGYFIAFLSFPYFFIGEELLIKTFRSRLRHRFLLNLYDIFHWWFIKMAGASYLFTAHDMIFTPHVLRYFTSTYFSSYVVNTVAIIVCLIVQKAFPSPQRKTE